jgi:polysaccharide export outer membrane protein
MAAVVFLALFGSGCGGRSTLPQGVQLATSAPASASGLYRIDVGDELSVEFFYQPDMSRKLIVRTDGRITLPAVGELAAAGQTPEELSRDITRSYSSLFKDPLVTVTVTRMSGARVYVVGEVARPGGYDLTGRVSVASVISQAGGPTRYASLGTVKVIRRGGANPLAFKVDASSVRKGSWEGPEVLLAPNDILVVPRSGLGHMADVMGVVFQPGLITLYTLLIVVIRR